MSQSDIAELVRAFTDAMTTDDIDAVVGLFNNAPDVEWVIMATGERFRGLDSIRQLAERSVAARSHGDKLGIKPKRVFTNAEGSQMCWEYVHKGMVTEHARENIIDHPAPGTIFELPIVLVCDIRNGRIQEIREYFDLRTLTEAGRPQRLYA
jgi:ketosteroid isomerase-like protein